MEIPGLAEEPFPVRSREAAGSVNGIPTEVTLLDFADKILLTIAQEGSLSQWVSLIYLPWETLAHDSFAIWCVTSQSLTQRFSHITNVVFLQITPYTPAPDPGEGTHLHWIPISSLVASASTNASLSSKNTAGSRRWTTVTVDVSSRLTPRNSTFLRLVVRMLLGSMQFNAILLESPSSQAASEKSGPDSEKAVERPNEPREVLKLWGLSLGMTLDFIAYMHPPSSPFSVDYPRDEVTGLGTAIAPSMT